MFERLRERVKGVFGRMAEQTGGRAAVNNVFELPGVPAYREFYELGIFVWKYLWRGPYKAWHLVPAPTIKNPQGTREIFRLDVPKALSAELASLIWSEQCDVHVSRAGFVPADGETDPLDDFLQVVLKENNFFEKLQENIEQCVALGGAALKEWHDVKHDADGNPIPDSGKIKIGYCRADQIIPISWDNAKVKEAVFVSRIARRGYYYTRLEWHRLDGETYTITNELYKVEANAENQSILGFRCPLDEVFPYLNAETEIRDAEDAFFSYYRTPIANNLDDDSPLGVSAYGNAMSTLHAIDICYDSFVSEFRLGKKRIIVPARAVRTVIDPVTNAPVRYFDATDEVYEAMNFDDTESLKIQDNSVELRVEEHVKALNALLSVLCLQVGFSVGTFTFDRSTGLKTATEVISENSKTYKTVKSYQNILQKAIEKMASDIVQLGALYEMKAPDGSQVRDLAAGGYDVAVHFDDSILQDRQSKFADGVTLTGAGLMSKKKFMVDTLGYTPEQADAEIQQIAAESKVGLGTVDYNVFAGGAD